MRTSRSSTGPSPSKPCTRAPGTSRACQVTRPPSHPRSVGGQASERQGKGRVLPGTARRRRDTSAGSPRSGSRPGLARPGTRARRALRKWSASLLAATSPRPWFASGFDAVLVVVTCWIARRRRRPRWSTLRRSWGPWVSRSSSYPVGGTGTTTARRTPSTPGPRASPSRPAPPAAVPGGGLGQRLDRSHRLVPRRVDRHRGATGACRRPRGRGDGGAAARGRAHADLGRPARRHHRPCDGGRPRGGARFRDGSAS